MSILLAVAVLSTAGEPVFAVPRKGPWIANVGTEAAEIRWEVADPAHPGALVVGTATIKAEVRGKIARARIDGLAPDRAYDYRVDFSGISTATHLVRTLPEDGQPVSFVAIGDTRTGHTTHARLAARIASERPDFVVTTGDLVGDGRREEDWQAYFEAARAMLAVAPVFAAVGNHDSRSLLNESLWAGFFPETRYREIRAGVLRLVIVDTTQSYGARSKQGAWLRARLARAKEERASGKPIWVVAMHHHPAFSSGHHGSEMSVQRELVPLYEEFGVDLVLQGHDHIYERLESGGVVYVVTGGGGAPLYKIHEIPESKVAVRAHHYLRVEATRDRLAFVALGLDGETIDSRELVQGRKRAALDGSRSNVPIHLGSAGVLASFAVGAWIASARYKKAPASP